MSKIEELPVASLLGLPLELFDIIVEYLQYDPGILGSSYYTKRHLFRLKNTCSVLKNYLEPRWDSMSIQINTAKSPRPNPFYDNTMNFCVTNDNIGPFCRSLIRRQMDRHLVHIKHISIVEQTPYTWGDCSSTILLHFINCNFDSVRKSHLFSWLLTMGLRRTNLPNLASMEIRRMDGEGSLEREELARIFTESSALEHFVREFRHIKSDVNFTTTIPFQLADSELYGKLTSLALATKSSFKLIQRNLMRKLVSSLPATLRQLRLDVFKVDAHDLAPLFRKCTQLAYVQISAHEICNILGQNWLPNSVRTLRLHDKSVAEIPTIKPHMCLGVEELVLDTNTGYIASGMILANLKHVTLMDSSRFKILEDDELKTSLCMLLANCRSVESLSFGFPLAQFEAYIPQCVRSSIKVLKFEWYFSNDKKCQIIRALKQCPSLERVEIPYQVSIRANIFARLLFLVVASCPNAEVFIITSRINPEHSLYQCVQDTASGYKLDKMRFVAKFKWVRIDHYAQTVQYEPSRIKLVV